MRIRFVVHFDTTLFLRCPCSHKMTPKSQMSCNDFVGAASLDFDEWGAVIGNKNGKHDTLKGIGPFLLSWRTDRSPQNSNL